MLDEAHPLHALFEGRNPPALMLLSKDGKQQVAFLGTAQQKVAWTPIARLLATAYEKDPTSAVKAIEKLLCKFDKIDGDANELNLQLVRARKKQDEAKAAVIQQKLVDNEAERKQALAEEAALREIVLRGEAIGG